MIFNTWIFGLFTVITFLIYWFGVPQKYRAHVLLFASYLFFTYHFPWHTLLILFMTCVVYILSLKIFETKQLAEQRADLPWYNRPKFYLITIIVFCVSILMFYKYLKMAISTLNGLFHLVNYEVVLPIPDLIVPLGLSFFVFEFIHYAIDVYHGTAQKTGPFQFALFIMYFPTLVSGPIKRYQSFNDQTMGMARFQKEYLFEGLTRIVIGIFKKIAIADQMTQYASFLHHPASSTTLQLWIGMYAYTVKIYFDFSGYSDIAIGTARLFGYRVPENFNHPYLRKNISEFWNNWHMSLSSWIRDYIYIPLGGNRGSMLFAARNSLISMAISGLWHGAAWHFVLWGLYHGFGLAVFRVYRGWKKTNTISSFLGKLPRINKLRDVLAIIATFHFVAFGWILFYCDTRTAIQVVIKMIGGLF